MICIHRKPRCRCVAPLAPVACVAMSWTSKGKGKSGKGSWKGMDSAKEDMAKLKAIDPSQKVWIGGLPPEIDWKQLQQMFNQVGRSIYAAAFPRSNTGCVAFKTPEEVNAAVTTLNGSWIGDNQIEVDYFTKPAGRPKGKGKGKDKGSVAPVWKPVFEKVKLWGFNGKGNGKGKGKGKGKDEIRKLKAIDNTMKVWIGNLDGSVTWKMLQDHFQSNVGSVTWATVFPKGTGCVCFKTPEDAQLALALNESKLGTCTLLVDVFESKAKQ